MTIEEKLMGMIGLARRGRYADYGEDLTFRIRKKQIIVLFLASDASDRTQRVMEAAVSGTTIRVYRSLTKEQLGLALGHDPVAALGIRNSGIAKRIKELEEEIQEDGQKEQTVSEERK
jgi:ribosomal protein L7Ae-like RNA K-turn-binding protein